jgi:hypothetical protein
MWININWPDIARIALESEQRSQPRARIGSARMRASAEFT